MEMDCEKDPEGVKGFLLKAFIPNVRSIFLLIISIGTKTWRKERSN